MAILNVINWASDDANLIYIEVVRKYDPNCNASLRAFQISPT